MNVHVKHIRDLQLLNLVGRSLFRRILKTRDRSTVNTRLSACRIKPWYAENDGTVVGYEAGWPSDHSQSDI
jgi:hypothetical protein